VRCRPFDTVAVSSPPPPLGLRPAGPAASTSPLPLSLQERGSARLCRGGEHHSLKVVIPVGAVEAAAGHAALFEICARSRRRRGRCGRAFPAVRHPMDDANDTFSGHEHSDVSRLRQSLLGAGMLISKIGLACYECRHSICVAADGGLAGEHVMARLVYACRFDVAADSGMLDVISTYRDWINEHYKKKRKISEFDFDPQSNALSVNIPERHLLSSDLFQYGDGRVCRIRWSFPDDANDGLRWSNEIRIGQFGDRCGVEHLISIESVEYSISPAKLLFGSPRAVRDICMKTPAFIGEMQVRAEPYQLKTGNLSDLMTLLTSSLRKLPVVLLSPYPRGEPNQLDPVRLARNLAGIAVVVRIDDPELTWDFADEVGRQLSCFNGAARIYWPGFDKDSDPRSHKLIFGNWIDQVGPDVASRIIEKSIFAVATFRYVPDKRIASLIRQVEAEERQKFLAEKKETGEEFWADYERDLARLQAAQSRIEELEAENANLRANQGVFFVPESGAADELEEAPEETQSAFVSVAEATNAAAKKCKNLEILSTAISAAEDSPFKRPYDIFKALSDLDEIVNVWRDNNKVHGNGGDLLQHLRDRGWGKRSSLHISNTTRSNFRSSYEFKYQGKKQIFEPHITIGSGDANNCASIHFIFDQNRLKIVVGHVGKHLPNTKT
jgi:hypothetical protein